jgi:hypothetical protein
MSIEKLRIVTEYVFRVEGLNHVVKGRVEERLGGDPAARYSWSISHHYRPSENAWGVYYPSKRSGPSIEVVESLLMAYADSFTTIDVTPTEYY